jgi:endogenous inhibitor of DNA gyrase (YacG/DUF329 family)
MPEKDLSIVPGIPCPICGKPKTQAYSPFCSKRCADVDLHRWLSGVYRIESKEDDEENGGAGEAPRGPEEEP